MTDNPRYRAASAVAGEAMDALYTAYWADSFQADLLQERLTEIILFFIRNARSLDEPHPNPELLDAEMALETGIGESLATPSGLPSGLRQNGSASLLHLTQEQEEA